MRKIFSTLNFIITILFVIFFGQIKAQSSQSTSIQFSSNDQIWIYGSAINNGNRIISVGYFSDSGYVQKPSQGFAGSDSFDAFIVCTDEAGNLLWKKIFGSQYNAWCMNVVCDKSGNSYVSGYFEKSFVLDGDTFSSPGNYNNFLMKLDSTGKVIWGISYAVPYSYFENNFITAMTCDESGNLYYSFGFLDSVRIKSQRFSNNNAGNGSLLIKFDKNGNLSWGRILENENEYGSLQTVAVDLFGHVYIGGPVWRGGVSWGGAAIPGIADTKNYGLFIAKLDAYTGNMIWMKIGEAGIVTGSALTHILIGGAGAIYASGYFSDSLNIQGQTYYSTPHTVANFYIQDGLVINMDTSGKLTWLQHYGDPKEADYPEGFCLDQSDNVYVGGPYDAPITLNNKTLFSTIARDIYVMRFDKAGNYNESISSKAFPGSILDMQGLMTDENNKILIAGNFNGQANLGGNVLSSPGSTSGFIWEVDSSFKAGIEPKAQEMDNGFRLYPNPLNGNTLNLEIDNNALKGNIEISCVDITGKLLINEKIGQDNNGSNNYVINLPDLTPGLYLMRVISSNRISVQKFINE